MFGEDGAWLLFSVLYYGWRAYYDLATSIVPTRTWSGDDPLGGGEYEFQIVRDLHVQGLMYAAAEQLATLVYAVSEHEKGRNFFEAYVSNVNLPKRISVVAALDRKDLNQIMGVPADVKQLAADLAARGTFDSGTVSQMFASFNNMVDGIHRNLDKIQYLVERPTSPDDSGIQPQSLREVDNSFRHGLRVLFLGAVPNERRFYALYLDEGTETHHVGLYLPRSNEQVSFASVACSPNRTETHIETTRMLCLRMGQVVRGVIGRAVFDNARLLADAACLCLDGKTDTGP